MAVTLDATSQGNGLSGTTLTFSHVIGSGTGRLLLVVTGGRSAANVSGVTYNGVALTEIGRRDDGSTEESIWYLVDPDTGTHDIVVTKASGIDCDAGGISFFGASVDIGSFTTNAGFSTSQSQAITTNHDSGFVVAVVGVNDPGTLTYTGAGTQFFSQGSDPGYRGAYKEFTGGADVTHSWTSTNNRDWASCGVEVYPSITTYDVTVTAKARVKLPTSKTVTAKSRIEVIGNTKTVTAKARVKISGNDKTISARAKIGMVQTQTIQAKADIFNSVDKTVDAKARISQDGNTNTIDAKARILKIQSQEIQSKARMEVTQGKTIQAKARIEILSTSVTVTAKARVKQAGVTNTIAAMARILKVQTQTIQAKARMWAARLNVKIGRRADGAQSGVRFVRHG